MPDEGVKKVLWWFGLVVAPAVLIGIELFHPAHFTYPPGPGMYQYLSKPEPYEPRRWPIPNRIGGSFCT